MTTKEPFKPEMSLRISAIIPIAERCEGEELYNQLREMFKSFSEKTMLSGIISETLEPCCQERKEQKPNAEPTKIS